MSNGIPPPWAAAGIAAGSQVAGYRLEMQLGRGGMAVVFRAHDERLDRHVALKVLAPVLAEDIAFRQRFIRESRAAAAVDDPHIIPVYDAGEADGVLFIAMRLVRGGDLRTLVARHGPLAPGRAEWILSAVASALDAAHGSGLVHRDVKPANMLLDVRQGRLDHVYVSDFGVSKAALGSSALTGSGQFIGTADYAAPEQIKGLPVDGRTDQYALGCSAFELLSGRPPFAGKQWLAAMYAQISEPPPSLTAVRSDLPAAVDDVFARVLAKSPDDRYSSCEDFASALRSALGSHAYAAGNQSGPLASLASDRPDSDDTVDPAAVNGPPVRITSAIRSADAGDRTGQTEPLLAATPAISDAPAPPRRGAAGLTRWRPRDLVLSAIAAAIVIPGAAAGAFVLARAPSSPASVSYVIKKQNFPDGLAVAQRWQLGGAGGTLLNVTVTVSNASGKAVGAQLVEPIPAAAAPDTQGIDLSGSATLQAASRTAVWEMELPARGQALVGYQVAEPSDGLAKARLMRWVRAFGAVASQQNLTVVQPGTLVALTITPASMQLDVGQGSVLQLGGTLFDGAAATRTDLSKAVWMVANPAIARVNARGRVTGKSAGITQVIARIGAIRAAAAVMVVSLGSTGPPGGVGPPAQPGQSASVSISPSPSGSASQSVSPSPSGSASNSVSPSPSVSAVPAAAFRQENNQSGLASLLTYVRRAMSKLIICCGQLV